MKERDREEGCFPPPFPEDFGERLERLIKVASLSQEEFAQHLGIDYDRADEWFEGAELTEGRCGTSRGWRAPSQAAWRLLFRKRSRARSSDVVQRRSHARPLMVARASNRLQCWHYMGRSPRPGLPAGPGTHPGCRARPRCPVRAG